MKKAMKTTKHCKEKFPEKKTLASSAGKSSSDRVKWVICGFLIILTYVAFAPAFKNNFISGDDNIYILDNLMLSKSIGECINHFFSGFYGINYHPLTMIIYSLEFHSAKFTPELYHAVNIIIHILNVLMVFWFIYLLSDKKIEVAAMVAFLFGVHPMHVESVAWISELKDVLYTFFFMGALISYYKYSTIKSRKYFYYFLTLILFILSGLSKPSAVAFTLVLPLIDYYQRRKNNIYMWLEKLPFLLISIVLGILTIKAQSESAIGHVETSSVLNGFLFMFYGMMTYLEKLFLPINLSFLYPIPQGSLPVVYYIAPFLALLLFFLIYKSRKYTRIIVFGFLFFLVNIILVLQFVTVGHAIIAERYTYVSYIGIFFIIAMGFSWIFRNKSIKLKTYKTIAEIGIVIVAVTFVYTTNSRCKTWMNSELIWTDVLNQFPDAADAYLDRGNYFIRKSKYDSEPKQNEFDKALDDFNKGISLNPNDPKLYNCRAYINNIKQNYSLALSDYSKSINLNPNDYETFLNRGSTYSATGKYDSALGDYDKALNLHGGDPQLYQNRAYTYLTIGKYKESLDDYNNLIESGASISPEVYFYRSFDYLKLNNFEASLKETNKALEIKPDYREAYYHRSRIYYFMNKFQQALDDALKAKNLGFQVDTNYIVDINNKL